MQTTSAPADGGHRNISAWAIRSPTATLVLFLLLTIAGLASLPQLRLNGMPDLDLPTVAIAIAQPGAVPAELEAQVTRRVEDAVAGLGDVRHVTSTIADGVSNTFVEFVFGTDINRATGDIRDKVAQIRAFLPAGVRDPVVARVEATGGPILTYAAGSDRMSEEELSRFVDDIVAKALLALPGVAQVNRVGGVDREVRIALRPDRLLALGVTAGQVNAQVRDLNLNVPAGRGTLGIGEQAIRALGSAPSVDVLRERPVVLPGGRTARLGDIAEVTDGTAEVRTTARLDGLPVVGFAVLRGRSASEVRLADEVAKRIRRLGAEHPGVEIRLVSSTVVPVLAGHRAAVEALLVGAGLAVLVVWAFLRDWRATAIASLAMPLSLVPTFLVMRWLGFSLNNVTLLGLTLVVGVLLDDAIVEVENIVRHLRERPAAGAYRAALDASAEIGPAVVATTAAILAMFVPVAFMPGIPGQFFREFGLTVAAAVALSLVVARLLTPLLGAHLLNATGRRTGGDAPGALGRRYLEALRWCLRHRRTVMAGGIAIFVLSLALVPLIPRDFVPRADHGRSVLSIELAPGAALAETVVVAQEAARILRSRPEVASVFAAIGVPAASASGGSAPGTVLSAGDPRTAELIVTLVPRSERAITQRRLEALVRPELEDLPGARVRFGAGKGGGSRLQVTLVGDDAEALTRAARDLEREMRGIPHLTGVRSAASLARPELRIVPHEDRAAELGVSVAAIGAAMRIATVGDVEPNLARFGLADRQIPIRVMLDERARENLDELRALRLEGRGGVAVPLGAVAEVRHGAGPAQLDRLDRVRKATVEAELDGIPLGEATRMVADLPAMRRLPNGVRERTTGDAETMAELFRGFGAALGAGILLVYLVLVLLLGGILQPLAIMSALPLALGGALLTLLLTQKALGISAAIGLLMLMGIVAKNSILLVDYAVLARRERGLTGDEAVLEAARKRARPIVMTTVAMCAGMVHVAAGIGSESEFRSPMAHVLIGGLVASTLLSLVFVPVACSCMGSLEDWLGHWRHPRTAPARMPRRLPERGMLDMR
jgi:HAE1 family hydrophobic/amphiphilic exporter-1